MKRVGKKSHTTRSSRTNVRAIHEAKQTEATKTKITEKEEAPSPLPRGRSLSCIVSCWGCVTPSALRDFPESFASVSNASDMGSESLSPTRDMTQQPCSQPKASTDELKDNNSGIRSKKIKK
jgi:hypothetical protein